MQKSPIARVITIVLDIILIGGVIVTFFIPTLYNIFKVPNISSFQNHTFLYKLAFYLCYFTFLGIIFFLIKVFHLVYNGSPFKKELVLFLKSIAVLFMLLTIIIFIKFIFIPSILSIVAIVVTFIASLSFYVLSQVFKTAIAYKHEIDFII